jgi:hypothetical protein
MAAIPAATSSRPAGDVADAGEVAPVGARVDDVQPVGDDPEDEDHEPDHDAQREPRRARDVRLGQRPPAARATMTAAPSSDVSGPERRDRGGAR